MPRHPPCALLCLISIATSGAYFCYDTLWKLARFATPLVLTQLTYSVTRWIKFAFKNSIDFSIFWFVSRMSWLLFLLKNRIFIKIFCMKFSRYICDLSAKHLVNMTYASRSRMEMERFELLTPCLQGRCSPNWATPPRAAMIASIFNWLPPMGLSGLEPPTSRLSGVRSNQLRYKPVNSATSYFPIPSPV